MAACRSIASASASGLSDRSSTCTGASFKADTLLAIEQMAGELLDLLADKTIRSPNWAISAKVPTRAWGPASRSQASNFTGSREPIITG